MAFVGASEWEGRTYLFFRQLPNQAGFAIYESAYPIATVGKNQASDFFWKCTLVSLNVYTRYRGTHQYIRPLFSALFEEYVQIRNSLLGSLIRRARIAPG